MGKIDKKENLYIPMGIKEENEFWEGFGGEELKKSSIFIGISLVINILINIVFGNVFFFMAFLMISIGVSFMIFTKGSTNLSVVDQIGNMRDFSKSQKKYYYKALDEWR